MTESSSSSENILKSVMLPIVLLYTYTTRKRRETSTSDDRRETPGEMQGDKRCLLTDKRGTRPLYLQCNWWCTDSQLTSDSVDWHFHYQRLLATQGHYLLYSICITSALKKLQVRTAALSGVGGFK